MTAFFAADWTDYVVPLAVAITAATGAVLYRWVRHVGRLQFRDEVAHVVTDLITNVVEPKLDELRKQNIQLQRSIDEAKAQNARDHNSVAVRLDAVEKRLPPPPPGYLPPTPPGDHS